MAQFVVDIEVDSMTDSMNEMKYIMKIVLVIFNVTISNFLTTSYISTKDQFVNTIVTRLSSQIDVTLIVLFVVCMAYAIKLKYQTGHV